MNKRSRQIYGFGVKLLLALGLSTGGAGCVEDTVSEEGELIFKDTRHPSADTTNGDAHLIADTNQDTEIISHQRNPVCQHWEPILIGGQSTGFERCIAIPELIHRAEITACPSRYPRDTTCPNYANYGEWTANLCLRDAECEPGYYY